MRIFIACSDERLRLALILLVEQEPANVVVGISDRLAGLLAQLEGSEPDALLLDLDLPLQSTADLLAEIQALERRPEIIVFSARPREKGALMAAGAYYCITKDSPPDELLPILNDIRLSAFTSGST
jgi:DNA-binding NarL/FixJ family response regulator